MHAMHAESLQSCPTLCNPMDRSPPGSSVPGILQARILEWVAISFSNTCVHAKSLQSCPTLCDPMDDREGRICTCGCVTFHQSSSVLGSNLYLVRMEETLRAKELSKFLSAGPASAKQGSHGREAVGSTFRSKRELSPSSAVLGNDTLERVSTRKLGRLCSIDAKP